MRFRLLVALSFAACTRTETVTRVVNLHVLTGACRIPDGSFGEYVATGDYAPPASNHSSILATDQPGQTIDGVPADVQSLALLATSADATQWQAVTLVPAAGDVDMLLLPASSACALNLGVGFDSAMVFAAVSSGAMIATGATVKQLRPSFRVDLGTGRVAPMTNGIRSPRTHAAVASLGDGRALVIGGATASSPTPLFTGEVYDDGAGDFESATFSLPQDGPLVDAGAVMLANGDVFVAGGTGNNNVFVTPTVRVHFDAKTSSWDASEGNTPELQFARTKPYVLRLADGTVLVGGGFDKDGNPETHVEFFSANGSTPLQVVPVPATQNNAFVALDGGGALFVDAGATQHAKFISPNGTQDITPDVTAPLTDVKLFPRGGGGALLWTGSTWLAFDPWTGFTSIANAPQTGPDVLSPIAWSEPGMRAWISPSGTVSVWRDGVRNEFATEGPYLVTDTSFMTPDSLPAPTFDTSSGLLFDDANQTVFVADARYLDVAIDVDGDGSALPHVVLRSPDRELDIGGPDCPYLGSGTRVHVERHGAIVSLALGGPLSPCNAIATDARVAVGVRGASAGVHARNLIVTRLSAALR